MRIPVDYELVMEHDGSFKEKGFKRIEDCILWCREYGLNMILDLHKTIGFSFDAGENETGFFENERYQEIFYGLWEEFAKRFSSYENVSFELLNEVSDKSYCETWNKIIHETVKRIRAYASRTRILVGGYYNNSITAIKDLDMPYDENIVYNYHCYSPLVFTHQGAYWIPDMDTSFRMDFDAPIDDYRKYALKNVGPLRTEDLDFAEEGIDESYFERMFEEALRISEERNVPLYCGEYGVIDRADVKETIKWFRCIEKVFDRHDIGRALWSYKEMDFGLVDAHYDDIREELIRII